MTIEKKKFKFYFSIDAAACMSCAACELECKDNAVYIDDSANYAINQDTCRRCARCYRACPSGAVLKTMNT